MDGISNMTLGTWRHHVADIGKIVSHLLALTGEDADSRHYLLTSFKSLANRNGNLYADIVRGLDKRLQNELHRCSTTISLDLHRKINTHRCSLRTESDGPPLKRVKLNSSMPSNRLNSVLDELKQLQQKSPPGGLSAQDRRVLTEILNIANQML